MRSCCFTKEDPTGLLLEARDPSGQTCTLPVRGSTANPPSPFRKALNSPPVGASIRGTLCSVVEVLVGSE